MVFQPAKAVCLIALIPVVFGAKRPIVKYDDTRTFSVPCEQVWPFVVPVVSQLGFMPDSSDRAGGFMRLRFTRGASGWLGSEKDINTFTLHRVTFLLETYDRFQISGAAISLTPNGGTCFGSMQVEYQGLRGGGLAGRGWVALPSNGLLESRILGEVASRFESNTTTPPVQTPAQPEAAKPEQTKPEQQKPEQTKPLKPDTQEKILLKITSAPDTCEIEVDGKYFGSSPAELDPGPGEHVIAIKRHGYVSWKRTISVKAGDTRLVHAELDKEKPDPNKPVILNNDR